MNVRSTGLGRCDRDTFKYSHLPRYGPRSATLWASCHVRDLSAVMAADYDFTGVLSLCFDISGCPAVQSHRRNGNIASLREEISKLIRFTPLAHKVVAAHIVANESRRPLVGLTSRTKSIQGYLCQCHQIPYTVRAFSLAMHMTLSASHSPSAPDACLASFATLATNSAVHGIMPL